MLVITGLGRSGTSCLAKICYLYGYDTGGGWQEHMDAGRECAEVVRLNYEIRDRPDGDYAARIAAIPNLVVKDPRFTWDCPHLLLTWWQCRQDLRFLVCHRRADEIAQSKLATGSTELIDEATCRRVYGVFLARLMSLNIPYRILNYPMFIWKFDEVYDALTSFGGLDMNYDRAKDVWAGWASPTKVKYSKVPELLA